LQRFGVASVVSAVNSTPGVRMEERSPGSYRLNIRGSSLRSPFGVRNVKVYYNDLPYTDPFGTTYLNQLGYYNFNSIEIIKGPGSSLYGAGTGGVVMVQSLDNSEKPGIAAEYSAGSFNYKNIYASISLGTEKYLSRASFQRQESDGYRNQSALRRDVHSWSGTFRLDGDRILKASFLYGDLFYETPGALTLAEYQANPKAARPGGGGFPGAEAAKASIRQKTVLTGVSYELPVLSWLKNKSVLYGMFTKLDNPNLRGYEKSLFPSLGGRTLFEMHKAFNENNFKFDAGGEWQEGFGSVEVHKNVNGNPDSLRTSDDINNRQSFVFGQATLDISNDWTLVAGASWNWSKLSFTRFTPATLGKQKRKFDNGLAPRFALMKRFGQTSIYTSVSKGFSPPATAELLPTGGAINLELEAENGINYELGYKGRLKNDFSFDMNFFLFELSNTIVQRRDAGGGDYFSNAGKTNQKGAELSLTYPLFEKSLHLSNGLAWISYTYHHFEYREFKQLNTDFSGNELPGVAPNTISAGYDLHLKNGFFAGLNYYFSDKLPLNDANTAFAEDYHLVGAKLGYEKLLKETWDFRITIGADNLLDQRYSLGNDINGFGGRYYNAAPGRNYFLSLMVKWMSKKTLM
ncbi:MAG: TonB-dependent receptor, partial [Flavisolibacter sp.]